MAGLAFLETGAFVGLIAPGETAVVLGGVVAAEGEVSLALLLPLAWLAAALGDLASFWLGKRLGRRFLLAHGPRLGLTAPRLDRVDDFFDRHGPRAILAGRFIGIVRAVAPFLAGASGMPLRAFLPWSLLGTAVWATAFTLIGYAFSHSFGTATDALTHAALVLALLVRRDARPAQPPAPAARPQLAAQRALKLAGAGGKVADPVSHRLEPGAQLRVARLHREHRVLEVRERPVRRAHRVHRLLDEPGRAPRGHAGGRLLEAAPGEAVPRGEARVGGARAAIGHLHRLE